MADLSQLKEAAAAVQHSPHAVSAWEQVEALATELERPDDVVALYTETLAGDVEPQVAEMIGERAGEFCYEWFGDDPQVLEKILVRVSTLAPASDSALARLSVIYTNAERWDDAFGIYDRAVDATKDKTRRTRLLREAAQLAKDVANKPDKAIGYYQLLLPLTPDDGQVSQSLERLLERHERWAELIQLWESRLDSLAKKDRERSRARIAQVWLDNLSDPQRSLAAAKPLLAEAEDDREPTQLLERVLESPHASKAVRDAALDLLRSHYDSTTRSREVIRVLEKVIALDPANSGPLHEEAGTRLADLDDLPAAMDHFAALLAMAPGSSATEEKLRQLAERGGHHDRYADGVATAARASRDATRQVGLLGEAARTRLEKLSDTEGAIKLLVEAAATSGASEHEQLGVARRLAALYAETNRPRERLGMLERQAHLEANEAARSSILSEAAKLAESLGDTERALALWERRIDSDPSDLSGLDARIGILENQERWDDLVAALESRAAKVVAASQKRADLVRIALVHHLQRKDLPAAITAWQRVIADHPDDEEGITALADLLAETNRWKEMADLLEAASGRATHRTIARLVRLGDALRAHLDQPVRALAAYRNAMAIEPGSKEARAGLTALLEIDATRAPAADALAQSFRINGDLGGVLELLPARLAEAKDDRTRLALLREAAQLRLEHKHDAPGALSDLARAFPLAPRDQLIENQIVSLAKTTGHYPTAATAYERAIDALSGDDREAARLRMAYADIVAEHLNDRARAADAYAQVTAVEPGNRRAVYSFAGLGAQLGRWDEAATAVVRYAGVREAFDDELLSILELAAATGSEHDPLAAALTAALDKHKVPAAVGALFAHRLAVLHRDHRSNRPAAIAALRKALELGGERQVWLTDLVALERDQGTTAALLDALRRLADADGRDLDSLVGAADVASKLGEREQALSILSAVLGRATAAWRGTAAIRSARSVDAVAKWAIDALVDLYRTGGRARAAVDTLVEAARLPFDQNTRRDMRLRAAQLATVELGDNAAAIDMYRSVLAQSPSDLEVIERLAHLLGLEDRVPELLTLRQIQLGLETDAEKRLMLRLELARLVGIVEERGGRLDALKANLEDRPGHDASIEAVAELLANKGQHKSLADLLEQQAQRLESAGDVARSARLWARYAHVAELDTKEVERAISGHRRVVALAPTSESLRALARLNLERSQPGQAVPWLESLLGTVPHGERLLVVSQLAKAHLSAHQPDRAIAAIEVNLDDKESALELRTLLADLYRKAEQWEPLARHLTRSLPLLKDDKLAREFAREASTIYLHKLSSPAKAIPALETALLLDPTDRDLRTALAIGQRVAGKLVEARAALAELIEAFGRRRSPERAALHVELARVSQAEGKLDEAMTEMEAASKMDVSNAAIQKELAEMARSAGQLDKAERTYRALLLVVRRQPPGDDEAAVGASEVLFELHKLAGESAQAKELLESAMEAAIQSDAEVRRLRRSLIAHGEGELLLQVLERRLATNPEPHSQARLLSDMAETLDGQLGRHNEALDALIRAIGVMPSRTDLHERARELAKRTSQTKRFVDAVDAVVDRLRRKDDPPLIANLLMRAGEALEQDADDLRGAASLYRRVEILGERLAEAFYAQARVAAALGDVAEQARTLDKMFELAGTDSEPTAAQVDALYRLAEIFLGSESRRRQGFDLLERAFGAEPRWAQAGRLLRQAATSDATDDKVMTMYERVARNGGDAELLLDFLERRAAQPGATPAQIREAVDLAVEHGQDQRAEALLVRAVAAARDTVDGLASAPWAVLALAERRLAAGDLTQARDLTYEIAPIVDASGADGDASRKDPGDPASPVDGLAMRIATRALAHRRVDLAADVYEFLRERSPADRAVWQPLLSIYRELGDGDRLGSVISSTLPALMTPAERNALRLEHVRFLIENLKRHHDALDVLRDALADDADNLEAAELYESTLRQLGDDDGIAEFLWSRFEDAQRRGHRDSTVDVALRLGDSLEKSGSPDAVRVYRAALIVAPDDREILRRVVAQLGEQDAPREGAVLMERLLAVETPERAPALAGQLATMWEAAGDMRGVQRTLELAHGSAPDDTAIHDRLEKWYRDRELWPELAELMTRDAERASDAVAVERLREAATVYSGFLGQPLKAAEVLRKARQRAPQVPELVTDHAAALAAAGELDAAQRAIGEALATVQGTGRTSLLMLRANFRQQLGDDSSAVSDLTEAYELDKERGPENLVAGLERLRVRSERDGDLPTERTATLKLAQLLVTSGELERGRAFLVGWIERDPRDAEPLYQLCELDESISHWDGVAAAATRLAYVTEGEAQVEAALRAASASTQAGRPGDAVPVLELVHQHQPAASIVRDKLREVYDAAGEYRLLAGVLVADADHGSDPAQRYANYKRAAELYLYHLEDPSLAQQPAQRALELQPEDHAALMLNVDVLIQSGQLEDAGRTLEAAIGAQKKRTPELAVLQQRMGKVSAALGDRDGQLNWLKKAFDVDRKNAEVAAELASIATEIGDFELALKPLRAITLMDNPSPITRPMALLWEAKIENARGNRAKAELWAKKALREDPAFAEAQQFLDELAT